MRWQVLIWLGAIGLVLSNGADEADAQFPTAPRPPSPPGPPLISRPAVSPYLNLLRRDQPAALNYYNLVRPQLDFTNAINRLNQDVQINRQGISALQQQQQQQNTVSPPTGHQTYFLNLGGYFLNFSGGQTRSPGARAAAAPPVPQQPPRIGRRR